eukprot:TRINITY_DN3975_c0_g1_i2.p1 TRINITY_DN3975_c0_g1~~TRINITY_DN3975_c0_g1_i2.p1  ORF type:complete len:127 (-),score=31.89 TRINITY_DN3975_c0_g1_i2:38-418(-)
MDLMMERLHKNGSTKQHIEECFSKIPLHKSMLEAIDLLLPSRKVRQVILSDANTIFIDTILRAYKIHHHFDKIITNPAHYDDNGRMRVAKYRTDKHDCDICPVNLCKGIALQEFEPKKIQKSDLRW